MTVEELRAKLSEIEPREAMYAGLTPTDVPSLERLLADPEDWMAARAIFALSRVGNDAAVNILARAVTDGRVQVRVAVAAAVAQRPITLPDNAIVKLLQDQDVGVRKLATRAVKPENGNEPRALLNRLSSEDAFPEVQKRATEVLRNLRQ
jgi:HEAT repeat protein